MASRSYLPIGDSDVHKADKVVTNKSPCSASACAGDCVCERQRHRDRERERERSQKLKVACALPLFRHCPLAQGKTPEGRMLQCGLCTLHYGNEEPQQFLRLHSVLPGCWKDACSQPACKRHMDVIRPLIAQPLETPKPNTAIIPSTSLSPKPQTPKPNTAIIPSTSLSPKP